jgi:hypothetical protein
MSMNSSGAQERFTLAAGEMKTWRNKPSPYGTELGNKFIGDVHGEVDVDLHGNPVTVASGSVVKLQTSEDGTTFTDVATVTLVARGKEVLQGVVGAYARILNVAGPGVAHVEGKFLGVMPQVVPAL